MIIWLFFYLFLHDQLTQDETFVVVGVSILLVLLIKTIKHFISKFHLKEKHE